MLYEVITAKASDDKITFGNKSTAYSPTDMDKIFKAYGLTLSPEDAAALVITSYSIHYTKLYE